MNDKARKLVKRYIDGETTPEENTLVEAGFLNDYQAGYTEVTQEEIESSCQRITDSVDLYFAEKSKKSRSIRRRYLRVATAAAALLIFTVSWWSYSEWHRRAKNNLMDTIPMASISNSDKAGATITLSDGRVIVLSDEQSGVMIGADNLTYNDGTIIDMGTSAATHKLTAATAKGQTYSFYLPDGTKVWLNAASEISFSQPFGGSKREVFLRGEAYFEVAKSKLVPFVVKSEDQTVQVLGTHFNVKAYPGFQERTTLLEGKIRVAPTESNSYSLLNPGQEALINKNQITIRRVDPEASVSWISGLFNFDGKSFDEIMQEVSDWYDLDIVYEGQIPKGTFFGQAYKSDNLSTVLRLLESAQLEYSVTNERKLIISNRKK